MAPQRTPPAGDLPGAATEASGGPPPRRLGLLGRLVDIAALAGIGSLILGIGLTVADIAWRRIIGGAFVDTIDITKLCLVAASSWSIPYGFAHGSHVSVDLLAERLPPPLRRPLDILAAAAALLLLAFVIYLASGRAVELYGYGDVSQNLRIPSILYWGIFLSGLALSLAVMLVELVSACASRQPRRGGPVP